MASKLVFLTGATGFIGFKTVTILLESGYQVLAAVRSEERITQILAAKDIQDLNPGTRLNFIVIPDLLKENVYDDAVKDATYIVHLASPMLFKGEINPQDYDKVLIQPAIQGTLNILKAAAKSASIKRVVITSSAATMTDSKYVLEEEHPPGLIVTEKFNLEVPKGPFPSVFHAYNASKVEALAATDAYMAEQDRGFDVVHIFPSFVLGRNGLATKATDYFTGSNAPMTALITGNKSDIPIVGATVHVDDAAYMHVKSLDLTVPAGNYIANSDGYAGSVWQNGISTVAESFPEAVAQGTLKLTGVNPTRKWRVDNSQTEKLLSFKFKTLDEQVKSLVGHYLELLKAEAT